MNIEAGSLITYDSDGFVYDAIVLALFADGDLLAITEAPENQTKEIIIERERVLAIDSVLVN